MVRVTNIQESLDFYCNKLGLLQAQSTPLVGAIHRDPELWASISAEPTNNSENNNLGELACTPSGSGGELSSSGGNCPVLG